ncbi:MAG: DUF2510 domain-containing protein [Actinomycetia bacterium]|nr:DUF2510 domain-containing protein [Actinomycetes bacterium]
MASSGWYRDPSGYAEGRFWDGERWTDQVITASGVTSVFPITSGVETPPAPASEYQPAASAPSQPVAPAPKASPVGAILGGVAVIVAVIALVIALTSDNGDDDDGEEESPPTTEAPTEPDGE